MQPRVVRVDSPAERFSSLFEAARAAGVRFGWLDFTASPEPPADLASAAESGALRAVSVAGRRIVSCKTLAGEPVLRDVIREHFTGCRLVLVRGEVDAPALAARSGRWFLQQRDRAEMAFTSEEFIAALRRPAFP